VLQRFELASCEQHVAYLSRLPVAIPTAPEREGAAIERGILMGVLGVMSTSEGGGPDAQRSGKP